MKRGITAYFLLTALVTCCLPGAFAHVPRHLAGSQCRVLFFEDRVEISIDLGFRGSWAQAEMLAADADRDSVVSKSEADAYLQQGWRTRVLRRGSKDKGPAITCHVDGNRLDLELTSSLHEGLVGQVAPTPFSLYYTVTARIEDVQMKVGTTHRVEIVNLILKGEVPGLPLFLVPFSGHGLTPAKTTLRHRLVVPGPEEQIIDAQGHRILIENQELAAELSVEPTAAGATTSPRPFDIEINLEESAAPSRPPTVTPRTREEKEHSFFSRALDQDVTDENNSWTLGFLLISLLLGAAHALTPGHGKTLVAAYLAGSNCRYRDAIVLGLTTTLTHTLTFTILGAILLAVISNLTMGARQERLITACMLLSGSLLSLMGFVIFLKRARRPNAEKPEESHDHPPACATPGGRLRELLGLGISSGLLPCSSAIMVILIGLHQPDKFVFSMLLLVTFSMGIGCVLVLIGVLTISGKRLVGSHRIFAPLRQRLPGFSRAASLVSALLIIALGSFLLFRAILTRPIEFTELFARLGN